MLDEGVQVLGGVRIERRGQDAAVAQRARAEFHAALHPGDDLVVVQLRDRGIDQFVRGEQVAEPQLAVLQHLLDFGRGEARPQTERFHGDTRSLLPVDGVPGFEHRADGRAGVARRRLHEDVAAAGALFERRHQQRVQPQPARQAQVPAVARHLDHGLLPRPAGRPRPRGPAALRVRAAPSLEAEPFVEPRR